MLKLKSLNDIKGQKLSIAGQEVALLGLEKYTNKNGKEAFTLLTAGSKFEGEPIGRSEDGYEFRFKGYIYAKKLVSKPENENVKVGKLL